MAEQAKVGFSPSTGQHFVKLPGNVTREVTAEQAALIQSDPGAISNILGSALETGKNLLLGGASLIAPGAEDRQMAQQALTPGQQEMAARQMVGPVSSFAGAAIPQIAADVAGFAAGGLPGAIAAGALTGAAGSPGSPLEGAAIGGAFGALPAVPGLVRAAAGLAGDMAGAASPGMMGIAAAGSTRMADRVAARIGQASDEFVGPPSPRVMKGDLTSQWFDQQAIPLTPSQRAMLNATSPGEAQFAKRIKWAEDIRGVGPAELAAQRQGFTNLVKQELGIEGAENLRPTVVADVLKREGQIIGDLTKAGGPVEFTGMDALRAVVKDADTTHSGALGNVVKDIESSVKRNGGYLDPTDMQKAMTRLREMSAPGQAFGKQIDAGKVLDELEKALEKRLTSADKEALKQARYRYKIAKTLDRTNSIGNDGQINPRSFGGAWDKKIGQTLRGRDIIGQAADTFDALSRMEANTGTTLQRVFAAAPGVTAKAATGAALTAMGVAGLSGAANALLGN